MVACRCEVIALGLRAGTVVQHPLIQRIQPHQSPAQPARGQLGQAGLAQPWHPGLQQLGGFHRTVVADEVIAPVIAPVHLCGALEQAGDFAAIKRQRQRLQPAQFDLGVLVHHLLQRQHEQPRRIATGQPAPVGNLHVADEGAEGQHTVILQIQPAIRPRRAARAADDQAQHAVAPAAHRLRTALGEQVIHGEDAGRIQLQQRRRALLRLGLQQRNRALALRRWE